MTEDSLADIKARIREASPGGVLAPLAQQPTGQSGVAGSPQATGFGTTIIVTDPQTGRSGVVDVRTGRYVSGGKGQYLKTPSQIQAEEQKQQARFELQTKTEQRQIASKKLGVVVRREVLPSGEIVWHGVKGGRYTFPSETATTFTARERPGGIPTKETSILVQEAEHIRRYEQAQFQAQYQREGGLRAIETMEEQPRAAGTMKYYFGRIPERTAYIKTAEQLTGAEKEQLIMGRFTTPMQYFGMGFGVGAAASYTRFKTDVSPVERAFARGVGLVRPVYKYGEKQYKRFDEWLIPKVQEIIPKEWESQLYGLSDVFRKQKTIKEMGISFYETIRTGEKQDIRLPPEEGFLPRYFSTLAPAGAEFAGGYVGGLREKPTQILIMTTAFFGLPLFLKGAGKLVGPVARMFPKTAGVLSKTAIIGLGLAYGTSVSIRSSLAPRPAGMFGRIAATEITPMIAGTALGTYIWPRLTSYFRTIGTKEIERATGISILTKQARAGQLDKFARERHLKLFKEAKDPFNLIEKQVGDRFTRKIFFDPVKRKDFPFKNLLPTRTVLHAASGIKETAFSGVMRRGYGRIDTSTYYDYLRGTFVAPSDKGAAYFLGLGGRPWPELYGGSLFQPYATPTFAALAVKGIRIRPSYPTRIKTLSGQYLRRFRGEDIPGVADIPLRKLEPEAVLAGYYEMTGQRYYVKYRGARVPIKEFKFIEETPLLKPIKAQKIIHDPLLKPIKAPRLKYEPELPFEDIFKTSLTTPGSYLSALIKTIYPYSKKEKPSKPLFDYGSYRSLRRSYLSSLSKSYLSSSYMSRAFSSSAFSDIASSLFSSGFSSRISSSLAPSSFLSSGWYSSSSSKISSGFSYIPSEVPPPTFLLPPPGLMAKKKKKKKKKPEPRFKYQPSVVAVGKGIFGKPPKKLTGLRMRPIIR